MEPKTILFAKHLSSAAKVCIDRDNAKAELQHHLSRMRKSVINLSLSYSDIDKLRHKIDDVIKLEREYAKFFKVQDDETAELRSYIEDLKDELRNERVEKQRIAEENNEKIKSLSESLENLKHQMRSLLMEKSKKSQRMLALEKKIREKVDVHSYYRKH
ncbi:MAG TPA: hypothetical protein VJI97_01130 [Candidatus Nanoarchaeia archaeon]|nr:hypothetical protein [Candidatus Nanoarchaeia archaeon]